MAYSEFTLSKIKETFGDFTIDQESNLFHSIEAVEVSNLLNEILKENIPLALAVHTEKARSEFIIAPILVELRKTLDHKISLFSGIDFNVDPSIGLNGQCDFIISTSRDQLVLTAPLILIVEAKNENIKGGLGQCIAEMIAAKLFNEREENQITTIYGVVTTGTAWRFLKLEDRIVSIDLPEYYIDNVGKILGIFHNIVC
ncbi:hypothetical protein IH992_01620 [Candidatus Poribacteria bacterium]|nr:hypothetical protein [Candidatus Poribacteria bacterium]